MIISILQLLFSLLIGILILFLAYRTLRFFINAGAKEKVITDNNNAFAIITGGVLLSVGMIMSGIIGPILDVFRVLNKVDAEGGGMLLQFSQYSFLFLVLGLLVCFVINIVSFLLFNLLTTDIKEMDEIRNGNVAVAIIQAVMIIVITMLVKDTTVQLLESIIPYPDMPRLF